MRVSSLYVWALVEALRVLGHDAEGFLRATPWAHALIEGVRGWVDLADFDRLGGQVLRHVDRDDFGVAWGNSAFQQFDMGRAAAYAPSLRAALERLREFQQWLADAPELTFEESGEHLCFRVHPLAIEPACRRVRSDFAVVAVFKLLRNFGVEGDVLGVYFAHPQPRYVAAYRAVIDAPLQFGQEHTGVRLRRSVLDRPNPAPNPSMERLLAEALPALLPEPRTPERVALRVLALLERDLGRDTLRMGVLAQELRMSERSLRRALAREGVSFNALVQEVRIARARALLASSGMSVKEVAAAVGFDSPTAFQRAFKRQTGMNPSVITRS